MSGDFFQNMMLILGGFAAGAVVVWAMMRRRRGLDKEVDAAWREIDQDTRRLQAVLSAMTEGLALLDDELRVVFCNPGFLALFRGEKGERINLPGTIDGGGDVLLKKLEGARRTSGVTTAEARLSSTPPRDILLTITPYSDDKIARGLIITALDITVRKQADQLRSEFVANVSHELRTPLAAISGYIETCLEPTGEGVEPPYRRFLPIIHQHAQRLTALIEDLLILSRIESRGKPMAIERIPIYPAVDHCITTLMNEAEKKGVALINALPPLLPDVRADPSALERILLNLIENAIKYSGEDSEVRLLARTGHGEVCIMVVDEGIGIPREHQTRIFERFYRVDKARSRKAGGTGLGLSIVKHLVLSHGGQVWVDSEPNRGSTFSFTLPIGHTAEEGKGAG